LLSCPQAIVCSSNQAFLSCFALPFFCAAPQQTEHLEEATHKAYQQYLQAQSRFGNGLIPVGGLLQNAPIQNNV